MTLSLLPRDQEQAMESGCKAIQACSTCRKQKRKCDKVLPACGLCLRMGRTCDYSDNKPTPTAEDLEALQFKLTELEHRLNKQDSPSNASSQNKANAREPLWMPANNKFPSTFFLDIDAFRWASLPVPKPPVDVPLEVLELLLSGGGVDEVAAEYFETIHPGFPFISKKRMNLGLSLWDGGPDLAMLFLAMKLITSQPDDGVGSADNQLYTASKRCIALLESSGTISLIYLQAMILVALYEYSHSIYPAAWMTVGACSRYCDILGLPSWNDNVIILGQCTTWTEAEERRRTWWAIFILDRITSLGSKKRFSAPHPSPTDLLPVDDAAWDAGDMTRALQRPVSTPHAQPASGFARTAQAGLLISAAMAHCSGTRAAHAAGAASPIDVADAAALTDQLAQLCQVVEADMDDGGGVALQAARCLTWSAIIMILDMYCCPENLRDGGPGPGAGTAKSAEELAMQVSSIEGLGKVSRRIQQFGVEVREMEVGRVSPFVLDSFYCALSCLHWLWKEGGDVEVERSLDDTRRTLVFLSRRWRLAGEYLAMERHHDITTNMDLRANS